MQEFGQKLGQKFGSIAKNVYICTKIINNMATIYKSLSTKEYGGKREILAKCYIGKGLSIRLKTKIFISPSLFNTESGALCNSSKTMNQELIKAKGDLSMFEAAVENIINVSMVEDGDLHLKSIEDWKTWVNTVFDVYSNDWGKIAKVRYSEIKDTILARKKEEEKALQAKEEKATKEENEKKQMLFFHYIDLHCKGVCNKKASQYISLKRHLLRYIYYKQCTDKSFSLDYSNMSREDVIDFASFLREEHSLRAKKRLVFGIIDKSVNEMFPLKRTPNNVQRGENQITEILKNLSAIFNDMIKDQKITTNPVKNAPKKKQIYNVEPTCLTREQRDSLVLYDLSSYRKEVRVNRDIFVFLCHTGIRYGDLCTLTVENIRDNVLSYLPNKTAEETGQRASVPLSSVAKSLIVKYKGQDPYGRLFPCPKESAFNATLKKVFTYCGLTHKVNWKNPKTRKDENRPINEIASSQMGRRSFTDINYWEGVPISTICQWTGRKPNAKSLWRYVNLQNEEKSKILIEKSNPNDGELAKYILDQN